MYFGNYLTFLYFCVILNNVKGQFEPLKVKPEKCYGTDDLLDRRCCIFPPFFKREVARACGAIFKLDFINDKQNVTGLRREFRRTCDHWHCVLDRYDLLDADKVNNERYFSHLDKWVNLNPEFRSVMTRAKVFCREDYRFYMPLTACEFSKFQSCIRNFINVDCPSIINSQQCMEWKEFYDDCREFFL